MKMKFMRKVTALFLALAMILGMTVTVSAIGSTDTGTIQVIGAEPGVSVTAYRLMDVNYDFDNADQPVDPVYEWVDTLAGWVRENYSAYIGTGTDNSVQEAFSSTAATDDIAAFYDALAAQIRSNSITLDSETETADGGDVDITDLVMGNYLVLVENGMKVYSPSAVNLVPVWNDEKDAWEMSTPAVVNLKSEEVSITKTAETADDSDITASIGDRVNYTVTADVPGYPAATLDDNKTFNIYDTLQAGLTLDADSIRVTGYVGGTEGEEINLTDGNAGNPYYTLTTTDAADLDGTGVSFSLAFNYDNLKDDSNAKFDTIRVTYSAAVNKDALVFNSNADSGNLGNTAKLSYSNNPYATTVSYKDVTDDAKVYTYGIKITKVDSDDDSQLLPGAEFTVSLSENGSNPISFVKTGDGAYRKAESGTEAGVTTVTTVTVGAEGSGVQGMLTLSGLDADTYYLTETKAPDGYNKLGSSIEITIADTEPNGIVNDGTDSADGADGYVEKKVENSDGFQLPTTGGIGTILFTAGGILLMGLGVIVLVFVILRRRRS
ncbi:MAG TPA: SpaH/EbpB family LPXTG-anchored major pilin [Candidatus Mediterraneibacter avicola]|nr:SpaH/EbpB family LPXTG-anchored major pilin [Candidatus Mediterraneibacter avicola]